MAHRFGIFFAGLLAFVGTVLGFLMDVELHDLSRYSLFVVACSASAYVFVRCLGWAFTGK